LSDVGQRDVADLSGVISNFQCFVFIQGCIQNFRWLAKPTTTKHDSYIKLEKCAVVQTHASRPS